MVEEKGDKRKVAAGPDERKRIWVTCITFLLCGLFILLYNVASESNVDLITKFVSDRLSLATEGPVTTVTSRWSPAKNWHNLLVEESSNYTSTVAKLLDLNATSDSECYHVRTTKIVLEGLPEYVDAKFFFQTDMTHHLTLLAYEENGRRCAGGDYYEVDFHDRDNVIYKSRLPTMDFGNGSYGLEVFVPSRFAGAFTLEIWLLFSNWHGLDNFPDPGNFHKGDTHDVPPELVLTLELQMGVSGDDPNIESSHQHLDLKYLTQCTQADFDRTTWQGRWTRSWYNVSCASDYEKRFHCLPEEHYWCEEPWCFGPVGRLESNGWQYSAHCSFKIFQSEEAWNCLDGKWILVWGDSNGQDTIRNLIFFVLGCDLPTASGGGLAEFQVERIFDLGFMNPRSYDQEVRISQIFNGHHKVDDNLEGMDSIRDGEHQKLLLSHFTGTRWPDIIIMNSAMHDCYRHGNSIESYGKAADNTILWWKQLYDRLPADRKPQLIWRTQTVPAGYARNSISGNPNEMEMYNLVMVEKFQEMRDTLPVKIVDAFDLTFPFHYDNEYSDGAHYGRSPGAKYRVWQDGRAHWYFVDVMLAHVLLNAVCPSTP